MERLAEWFGVSQSNIRRWFKYWLNQDWRRLLSQKAGKVLTLEVQLFRGFVLQWSADAFQELVPNV
ncbi:MAG: transposase family protein [Anaerolineae bacterium]